MEHPSCCMVNERITKHKIGIHSLAEKIANTSRAYEIFGLPEDACFTPPLNYKIIFYKNKFIIVDFRLTALLKVTPHEIRREADMI